MKLFRWICKIWRRLFPRKEPIIPGMLGHLADLQVVESPYVPKGFCIIGTGPADMFEHYRKNFIKDVEA